MATRNEKLNRMVIASPCEESWQEMVGSESNRFCLQCRKHVYDLADLEPLEIEALVEATQGRFCARITRDPWGRLITRGPSPEPATPPFHLPASLYGRRASPAVAAVVTALLGLTGTGWALPPASVSAEVSGPATPNPAPSPAPQGAVLGGQVVDDQGFPLPGATVSLHHSKEGWTFLTVTNLQGHFQFRDLPSGVYDVETELEGFDFERIAGLRLEQKGRQITFTGASWASEHTTITLGEVWMPDTVPLDTVLRESHLMVTGIVGSSVTVRELGPGGIIREVRTELHITSVLKGKPRGKTIQVNRYVLHSEPENLHPGDLALALLDPLGPNGRPNALLYLSADATQALRPLPTDPRLRPELGIDEPLWRAMIYLATATNNRALQDLIAQATSRVEAASRQDASGEKRLRARTAKIEEDLRQKFVRLLSDGAER